MKTSEEILSKATGIQAYNPTFRERSTRTVANLLRDKFGMDNYKAVELAQDIFGNPNAESILDQLGAATFSPAEALYGGQEGAREFKRADDLVGKGIGAATVGLSALEAFPATALMAKGIKKMFPKASPAKDVDLDRRKVTQGIAALPIAATGVAKVVGDLPMGAVAKVAKVAPKVTGSKLLDSLPFVKDELAPIIEGVLSNKTKINFLSSYKPVPPTPGNIPPPRPSLRVKEITPEDRLFQGLYQLNELRDRIKDFSKLENAKTLSDIGDTRIRDYDVIGEESPSLGITDNILNDFAEKYPDMSIDDAIKMVGKDGYDMFVKSFKSGELDNSDFLKYLVDYQTGPGDPGSVAKSKKLIEKVIKDNPDGTIDTVVYDIFGSDSIYDFMDADHDTAFSIGEEFFMPDEKARRAFKDGDMSRADFEKYIADKEDAGEEIKMYRSSN